MWRFTRKVLFVIFIPLVILLVLYVYTDPFKTIKKFNLDYVQDVNREYVSTELFLYNNPQIKYDSFILGSSVACALNIEHWKKYLPAESTPFLFQSWGETLTGIKQKVDFIDSQNQPINNVILLLDFPGSFREDQLPKDALRIKHYKLSKQPYLLYQLHLFKFFVGEPSLWLSCLKTRNHKTTSLAFDVITNNWNNGVYNICEIPQKDSLRHLSKLNKVKFLEKNSRSIYLNTNNILESSISSKDKKYLYEIKSVFDQHNTSYKILLSPFYDYGNNYRIIHPDDLNCIEQIFGKENIYNYTGKNEITSDYNNFNDPNHMGAYAAWIIFEDMFNKKN